MNVLFLLFFAFISRASIPDISIIREGYLKGLKSEKTTNQFIKLFSENTTLSPLQVSYSGAFYCLKAKHVAMPHQKLSNLSKGLGLINKAAKLDTNDIEIRFLRFSIENEAPSFLINPNHLATDKTFIVKHFTSSHPFAKIIYDYMIKKGGCKPIDFSKK